MATTSRTAGLAARPALGERVLFKSVLAGAVLWPIAIALAPAGYALERFNDANVYFQASRAYLAGASLYASPDFRQWPLVAALVAPLTLLPPRAALILISTLSMAAGLGGLVCLRSLLRRDGVAPTRLRWALAALGPPFLMLFYLGQMTGLCFGAYCLGRLLLDRRPRLAGLCFALMAAKPHLALLALPALATGGAAALVPFALGLLAWPLGSYALLGGAGLLEFVAQLESVRDTNSGLLGVALADLLPLTGPAHSAAQAAAGLGLVGALALLWLRRRGRPIGSAEIDLAAAILLAALPYARLYELLFIAPLLLRIDRAPRAATTLLLLGWWLLPAAGLALLPYGGGGLPALLAPAALGVWWLGTRPGRAAQSTAHRDDGPAAAVQHLAGTFARGRLTQ